MQAVILVIPVPTVQAVVPMVPAIPITEAVIAVAISAARNNFEDSKSSGKGESLTEIL